MIHAYLYIDSKWEYGEAITVRLQRRICERANIIKTTLETVF
jgi:hypothetical protein